MITAIVSRFRLIEVGNSMLSLSHWPRIEHATSRRGKCNDREEEDAIWAVFLEDRRGGGERGVGGWGVVMMNLEVGSVTG